MAVIETGKSTKLILRVATGTSAGGKTLYAGRTFGSINPEANNTALYNAGNGLAALQTHALGQIERQDNAVLTEE